MRVFFIGKQAVVKTVIICCSLALILAAGVMTQTHRQVTAPHLVTEPDVPEPVYHGDRSQKKVTLTCNVDWGEEYLPGMVDLFQAKKIKVTFFVTGRFADKFPDLVNSMAKAGHEIGNHGYEHFHPDHYTRQENGAEIRKAEAALQKAVGKTAKIYAPPYGESSAPVLQGASDYGYQTILWSVDTVDWQKPDPETIVRRVLDNIKPGDIVLMHPTDSTLKALPAIIDRLQADGYRLVTVSELLKPTAGSGKDKR